MIETNLQKYQEIQAMVRKDATDIAEQVYKDKASQYDVVKAPIHYHNGVDLPAISEVNIIHNSRYSSFIISDTTEVFAINKILPNLSRIQFIGFAANNAGGGAATKRAQINGQADFGKCFGFSGSGASLVLATSSVGIPVIQASNYLYIDATSQRVGAGNEHLVLVNDGTSDVVKIDVSAVQPDNSVVFTITLAATWKVQGALIIT